MQYEKRDKAFKVWLDQQPVLKTAADQIVMREAFNAGWLARKVTVDYAIDNLQAKINTMNGEKS